jgi:adenylosuccinate synthase
MSQKLADKIAIVLGAGQTPGETVGNGRATAVLFAREGATVICVDLHHDRAADTVKEIETDGGRAEAVAVDVTDEQQLIALFAHVKDIYGRIDILHNNVGVSIAAGDKPVDAITEDLLSYADQLRPYVADTSLLLNNALDEGKVVLLEGGQGTLLDVDHGTYPFVTSSNPTAGGACTGSGIGPTRITRVIGILKAYTTRVGSGPFPTELLDEDGERLRTIGGERGVTTGRPRRCGWFDAPIAKFATRVNGLTDIFLTKLDVLTGFEKIPVCVAYQVDGVVTTELPVTQTGFHHAKPVYEYLPGWSEDISGAKTVEDLPANARSYVKFLEDVSGTRISAIGVGQDRDATLSVHDLLD